MRDLKRRNAKVLACYELAKAGLEVFTPMTEMIINVAGRKQRREVPVIQDLLFVRAVKETLDPWVRRMPNLQYRFSRGATADNPTTVRDEEMERFVRAVGQSANPRYFMPGELTPSMYGRPVRIVGGVFDGYVGRLLSVRGMRVRRLIVEIPASSPPPWRCGPNMCSSCRLPALRRCGSRISSRHEPRPAHSFYI